MEIKLEMGIPIPQKHRTSKLMDTMRTMKVGESFTYPASLRSSVTGTATFVRQEYGKGSRKFTTRKIDEKTIRVWRIR